MTSSHAVTHEDQRDVRVVGRPDTVCRPLGERSTRLRVPAWIGYEEDVPTTSLAIAVDDARLDDIGDSSRSHFFGRDSVGYPRELILDGLADGMVEPLAIDAKRVDEPLTEEDLIVHIRTDDLCITADISARC